MARVSDRSRPFLQRLENGKKEWAAVEALESIAEFLDVPVECILAICPRCGAVAEVADQEAS